MWLEDATLMTSVEDLSGDSALTTATPHKEPPGRSDIWSHKPSVAPAIS